MNTPPSPPEDKRWTRPQLTPLGSIKDVAGTFGTNFEVSKHLRS